MAKFNDYKRVLGATEASAMAGKWLRKKGMRLASLAAVLGAGTAFATIMGEKYGNYEPSQAPLTTLLVPPLAVAASTIIPGQALTTLSNIFSSQKSLSAEANALNLMEDKKKEKRDEHLGILWDNVFKYESEIKNNKEQKEQERLKIQKNRQKLENFVNQWDSEFKDHFGINENPEDFILHVAKYRPLSAGIEATKEGFIISAGYALQSALPQALERSQIGFDLSLVEDWYDGAPFSNDDKLGEQFLANTDIYKARKKIGIPIKTKIKETISKNPSTLWNNLTTKKVGKSVGGLISKLNRRHTERNEPDYFNAQHILWKNKDSDDLVLKELGQEAYEDLQKSRKKMIREIFSNDPKTAHNQVYWMFGNDFKNATNLILDYDIERAASSDYLIGQDIREMDREMETQTFPRNVAAQKIKKARKNMQRVDNFLKANLPEIYEDASKRRAARTGYHLNQGGIQRIMDKSEDISFPEDTRLGLQDKAKGLMETMSESEEKYSGKIAQLRTHYELSKIQLKDYNEMVDGLAEYAPKK